MSRAIQHTLDIGGEFTANLSSREDGIDDERGRVSHVYTKLENFHVMIWIDGIEYDVTSSFTNEQLEHFKERTLNKQNLDEEGAA